MSTTVQSGSEFLHLITDAINAPFSSSDAIVDQAISQQLLSGEKHSTPITRIHCGAMLLLGPLNQIDALVIVANAIEYIHTASLIHDDMLDGAATRRTVPTIHTVYDNTMALAAGNRLLGTAFEQIAALEESLGTNGRCIINCSFRGKHRTRRGRSFTSETTIRSSNCRKL